MKNLLLKIWTITMLTLVIVGITSCSADELEENIAEVNFTATLPIDAQARGFSDGISVNTLVVGVFDSQKHEIAREWFSIYGSTVNVEFKLVENQSYSFVFWAYNASQSIYDMGNLTAIKMNDMPQTVTFSDVEAMDAFFATKENVVIKDRKNYPVELVRPLAQINVGSTGKNMEASFTASGIADTFHPFSNTVSGERNFTWNFNETTTGTFSANGIEYQYLAMGYAFAPTEVTDIAAILKLSDNGQPYRTFRFPQVEIQANFKSNIGGGFTTE